MNFEEIERSAKKIRFKRTAINHDRILAGAEAALDKSKPTESALIGPSVWRRLINSKSVKLAAAAVIAIAVSIGVIQWPGSSERVLVGGQGQIVAPQASFERDERPLAVSVNPSPPAAEYSDDDEEDLLGQGDAADAEESSDENASERADGGGGGLPFRQAQSVTKDKLPALYEKLKDRKFAADWHNIAAVIGCASINDPNSAPVLLEYFQRDDSWNFPNRRNNPGSYVGKIHALTLLGLVGGPQADLVLRKAISEDGAFELAKNWIDRERPSTDIEWIRGKAFMGLVFTGKPENIELAEQVYAEENAYYEETGNQREPFHALMDALAVRDAIAELGLEGYLGAPKHVRTEVVVRNLEKYYAKEPETPEAQAPQANIFQGEMEEPETFAADTQEVLSAKMTIVEFLNKHDLDSYDAHSDIKEYIQKDKLPTLYEMLKDKEYAPYWGRLAMVIGYAGMDDSNSAPPLLDYFQRDDIRHFDGDMDSCIAKIHALRWLGLIGGRQVDSVLRKATTEDGAIELAKNWINREHHLKKSKVIEHIRGAAFVGLAWTGKPENFTFIAQSFAECMAEIRETGVDRDFSYHIMDALAVRDTIAELGREGTFRIRKLRNPVGFVKNDYRLELTLYQAAKLCLTKGKLPQLYQMLEDNSFAPYWGNVAAAIACLSEDDPNSASVAKLMDAFQRDDSWHFKDGDDIRGKAQILKWLGLIGGPEVDMILRKATTEEGAMELAKKWINKERHLRNDSWNTNARPIAWIRGCAIMGLVYTCKPENNQLVEQIYAPEAALRKEGVDNRIYYHLKDALAMRDAFAEYGREGFFSLSDGKRFDIIMKNLARDPSSKDGDEGGAGDSPEVVEGISGEARERAN